MVSTRGGTRTEGADDKEKSTIQKKAVRKATAKAAPVATKAKTTRSKKVETEPAQRDKDEEDEIQVAESRSKATRRAQLDEDEEDEIQVAEPRSKTNRRAQPAKPEPAKRAATRPKKDGAPQKETAAKSATRTTKSVANTTTAKPKSNKNEKPDLPPPAAASAPAKSTRATRATRATAAKERVPPLSPKKITQISKVPAKVIRTAPKAKAPVEPSRPTTRRRNVSDENTYALATNAAYEEAEEKGIFKETQKNQSRSKAVNGRAPQPSLVEDETPASSRPTTPSDTIGLSFDSTEDEVAEASEEEREEADDFEEGDHTNNTSQDELCGPKTPMKRSSPRFGAQKASQASDLGVPSRTPARRFAVLGTQQGTPQTTRPYRQPNVRDAAVGPTTVSRARDRAVVFPRLQPLDLDTNDSEDDQLDPAEDEIISLPVHEDDEDVDADVSVQHTTISTNEDAVPVSDTGAYLDALDHPFVEDDDIVMEDQEFAGQMADSEETIVVPDDELDSGPASLMETSFNSNDSVIVTRSAETLEETPIFSESMQVDEMSSITPKPETLVWENIRQDVTIPFNFEVDVSLSQNLPEVEHNDRLSMANALTHAFQDNQDAVAGAEQGRDTTEDTSPRHGDVVVFTPNRAAGLSRESLDATVNLSDFIDVKSLSDSRRLSNAPTEPGCSDTGTDTNEDAHDFERSKPFLRASLARAEAVLENEVFEEETKEDTSLEPGDAMAFSHIPLTPARDVSELDIALNDLQQPLASNTPRYAMPTISSRRKSLPAKLCPATLFKVGVRPNTSDGAGSAGLATPSRTLWRTKAPLPSRPSTAHGLRSTGKAKDHDQTPHGSKTPLAKTPGTSVPSAWQSAAKNGTRSTRTPVSRTLFAKTPATSVPEVRSQSAKERFPGLPSRSAYELDTVVPSAVATSATANASPKKRFPAMPPCDNYEDATKTPHSANTPVTVTAVKSATKERFPGLPSKQTYGELSDTPKGQSSEQPATPETAAVGYSGLPHRRRYEEYAKTAMPASRFRTPSQSPVKRPATVQKQASLRKVALKAASTPAGSRTPIKTPLKVPAFTDGQVPMTPHPSVPLRGVVALVEVYTSDGDCATPAFVALLQRLGAKTTKTFSERLTHVVYKEGSPNTLQRLRTHNKQVEENGAGQEIHCVNSRWVTDCDAQGTRMPEADEAYAVEVDDVPRTAKRRRKSMEPMSLTNVKGSVFRNRQSSLGKSSLGRTPLKMDSPTEEKMTPVNVEDKENSGDDGSPATPAYLAAPDSLIRQTAPLNKIRKLDFKSREAAKNRRLTFWNGGN